MSRYSSDSDSSNRHRKSRRRRRSRSSSSSSSNHHRRSKKSSRRRSSSRYKKSHRTYSSRNRRRSRSRSNSRNSRSLSKDRRRRRSRSRSRDRYRSKDHQKSRSHSKGHSSRYHSRSSSNETQSRQSKSRSPVCSNSSSSSGSKKLPTNTTSMIPNSEDQLREKLMKAIKAAESADHQLKQQGVLAKGVVSRNDLSTLTTPKPQCEVIKAIEKDEFVPKTFTSSKTKKFNAEEVVPVGVIEDTNNVPEAAVNSIFHASFFSDPKLKLDRWIKKLYQIRQRAVLGEPLA